MCVCVCVCVMVSSNDVSTLKPFCCVLYFSLSLYFFIFIMTNLMTVERTRNVLLVLKLSEVSLAFVLCVYFFGG